MNGRLEEHYERLSLGVSLGYVGINRADQAFLDCLLRMNQHVRTVIEIGTFGGINAAIMGLTMAMRGGRVITIDINDIVPTEVRRGWPANVRFLKGDAFDQSVQEMVKEICSLDPTLIICDGGDKPREVREYMPLLRPSSLLAVHDFGERDGGEIRISDVVDVVAATGCLPALHDISDEWGSSFRAWGKP